MITQDGGLRITLTPEDVTWFSFLQYSRVTNSKFGGWDNSHWRERALDVIARPEFDIALRWLLNSVKGDDLPKPRSDDFKLKRDVLEDRGHLETEWNLKGADECSENALNFALFVLEV